MNKYDFYQSINARRNAIIRLMFFATVTALFWYFLWPYLWEPLALGFMMLCIWVIGFLAFWFSCIPYVKQGGQWLLYIQDRTLHIDFPECETERSFEISIDDITEINETRTRTHGGDRTSNMRPTIILRTGPSSGHQIPEPQEVRIDTLLKTLKRLKPNLPHRINGKIIG